MSREKSLAKNTVIITIGKLATQMITFFLLPLYTGILSTEEYGTVDLINTLVMLLIPIMTFQVEQGTFRMLVDSRNDFINEQIVITNSIMSTILSIIIFAGIGLPLVFYFGESYWYLFILIVIVTIESSLLLQISRGISRNITYAFASFLIAFSTIILNIIFLVVFGLKVNGMLLAIFLGHIAGCFYLILQLELWKYINFELVKWKMILCLWKYSFPLVPSSISWWIFNSSDRLIVTGILGLSMTGILSASHKFSGAYIMIYNIFILTWTESICIHIDDDDIQSYFNKIFNLMLGLFISIAIMLIAVMPFLYNILINFRYREGYGLIPLHLIGSIFNVILGLTGTIYIAKKDTKAVAITSLISAIINILVHMCLIKSMGLYASPVSTIAALAIMVFIRNKDIASKYFKIVYDKKLLVSTMISWLLVLFVYYQSQIELHICGIIVSIVFSAVWSRTIIKSFFNQLKR